MRTRRFMAAALAALMVSGVSPALAQQPATGQLAGKASDEAKQPYSQYQVQLRDVATGQVVSTVPLSAQGLFSFPTVPLTQRYLVELFQTQQSRVVCTEGPYTLTSSSASKTDVNIDCGASPAAWWLLAAGAGTAAAIAVATNSASQ
jgi:hypothetical protein